MLSLFPSSSIHLFNLNFLTCVFVDALCRSSGEIWDSRLGMHRLLAYGIYVAIFQTTTLSQLRLLLLWLGWIFFLPLCSQFV